MKRCHDCKSEDLSTVKVDETYAFAEFDVTVTDVPVTRCGSCAAQTISSATLGDVEMAVATQLAQAGIVTGETLRFMRKALGLSAKELAEMLNLNAETVLRWEKGERPVDWAAWSLMASVVAMDDGPRAEALARLRRLSPAPAAAHLRGSFRRAPKAA